MALLRTIYYGLFFRITSLHLVHCDEIGTFSTAAYQSLKRDTTVIVTTHEVCEKKF